MNGLTKHTLTRSNSVYEDSGWYGCIEKSKYKPGPHSGKIDVTPQNFDDANVKWIYVTVKCNSKIPFLYNSLSFSVRILMIL